MYLFLQPCSVFSCTITFFSQEFNHRDVIPQAGRSLIATVVVRAAVYPEFPPSGGYVMATQALTLISRVLLSSQL